MSERPRLLDLYCGEGGAARGYADAGWSIIGADIKDFSKYYRKALLFAGRWSQAHDQVVADLSRWDASKLRWFCVTYSIDAIHASPPCQVFTELNSKRERHANLIPHTRQLLQATGLPYIIENVRAAREHLIDPVSLEGNMFDCHLVTSGGVRFNLARERLFEVNWPLPTPVYVDRLEPYANVYGGHLRCRSGEHRTGGGTGRTVDFPGEDRPALARQLMGMPWATMQGMSEAVPPSYTRFIGKQLLEHLR